MKLLCHKSTSVISATKAVTPNEVREMLGLPQIKGGDKMLDLSPKTQANQRQNASGDSERQRERTNQQSDGASNC